MGDITSMWSWIPPWILTVLNFGATYPKGDEEALYSLADTWNQAGDDLRSIETDTKGVISKLSENYDSPGAQAVHDSLQKNMITGSSSLGNLASALDDLGSYTHTGGLEIETTKITEAGMAAVTAGTVISLLAEFPFGDLLAAPAAAAGREVMETTAKGIIERFLERAGLATMKNILKEIVEKITLKEAQETAEKWAEESLLRKILLGAGKSGLQGLLINGGAQAIEMLEGNRTSFDWSQAGENTLTWAAGGALGAPLHDVADAGLDRLGMSEGPWRSALAGGISGGASAALGTGGTEFAWSAASQALSGKPVTWGKDFSNTFLNTSMLQTLGSGGVMGAHSGYHSKLLTDGSETKPAEGKPPPTTSDGAKPDGGKPDTTSTPSGTTSAGAKPDGTHPGGSDPQGTKAGTPQSNGHSEGSPAQPTQHSEAGADGNGQQHNGQPAGSPRAGAPPAEHGDRSSEIAAGPKDTVPASQSQHGEPGARNADHRVDTTQSDEPTPATAKPDPKDVSGAQSGRQQEHDPEPTQETEKPAPQPEPTVTETGNTGSSDKPTQTPPAPSQDSTEGVNPPVQSQDSAARPADPPGAGTDATSNAEPSDAAGSSTPPDAEKSSAGGSDSTDNAESSSDATGSNAPATTEAKGSEASSPHPTEDGQPQADSHPEESHGQHTPASPSGGDHDGPGGDHADQPVVPDEQPHAVPPTRVDQAETAWDALTSALDAPEQQVMDTAALAQAAQWFGVEADAPVAAAGSADELAAGLRQARPDLVVGSPSESGAPEASGASEPSGVVSRLREAGSGSSALVVENRAGAAGKSLHVLRYEGSSGLTFDGKAVTDRGFDESGRQVLADANGTTYALGTPEGGSTRADQLAAAAVVVAHEPTAGAPPRAGAARTGEGDGSAPFTRPADGVEHASSGGDGLLMSVLMDHEGTHGAGSGSTAFVLVDRGDGVGAHLFTLSLEVDKHGDAHFVLDGQPVKLKGVDDKGRDLFTRDNGRPRTLAELTGGTADDRPPRWIGVWRDHRMVHEIGDRPVPSDPRPSHTVDFHEGTTENTTGKRGEYQAQIRDQIDGVNHMKALEIINNMDVVERGGQAQKHARDLFRTEMIVRETRDAFRLRRSDSEALGGLTPHEFAEQKVDKMMKGLAARHNPDLAAGGLDIIRTGPDGLPMLGDRYVNSSLGGQWGNRLAAPLRQHALDLIAGGFGDTLMHVDWTLQ